MKSFPNLNRWKFKKLHRPNYNFINLVEQKMFLISDGRFAIQAAEPGKLTAKQLESCRRTLPRTLGKSAQILLRPFTSVPVTQKSVASRMGKGKGPISYWIAVIRQGKIIVEVNCLNSSKIYLALLKASSKLPLKTNIINLKF